MRRVAQNDATGVETKRTASSDGLYNISPLIPGTYTVTVTANGFSTFKQENLIVDAMSNVGLNVSLKTGSQNETVTVTDTPPALETTNSTLGGTIENNVYTALPLLISGSQQRDVTQFSNLLPGAQVNPGGRSSIIGGTGQRLGELYLDGLPVTTLSQQGDNRPVFNIVPLEAIDQIKVVTSGFSAEYQGAGLENYNLKSGTNQYHGSIFALLPQHRFRRVVVLFQARRRQHAKGCSEWSRCHRSGTQACGASDRARIFCRRPGEDSIPIQWPRQALLLCDLR